MSEQISGIIPAVADMKQLTRFLDSKYRFCVIMNLHLSLLDHVFASAAQHSKKVLVHIDLINGLSSDVYGAEYIAQRYSPAAIISTKQPVITACRRLKTIAVQRVFLIDSAALDKSLHSIAQCSPDYVEVLPAMCTSLLPSLRERIGRPLIAGGLIPSREEAMNILSLGVNGVTISMSRLTARL